MKRKWIALLTCLLLVATMLPLSASAEYMFVVSSSGSNVNLREGPGQDYDKLTSIPYGELVEVIEMLAGSEWVNVCYDGYYGYVRWQNLSDEYPDPPTPYVPDPTPYPTARPTAKPTAKPTSKPTSKATSDPYSTVGTVFEGFEAAGYVASVTPSKADGFVHMRWAPTLSQPIFGDYYAGYELYVLYQNGSWCQVLDPQNNFCGYMAIEFLTYLRPMDGGVGGGDGGNGNG